MPIIRSSRLKCRLPHWSFRSWFAVGWRLGYSLQPGHHSSLTAANLQLTAKQERNDQCGNQHHSRELLMMGIIVPETCWAYKKYNKIISGIKLVFILQLAHDSLRFFYAIHRTKESVVKYHQTLKCWWSIFITNMSWTTQYVTWTQRAWWEKRTQSVLFSSVL